MLWLCGTDDETTKAVRRAFFTYGAKNLWHMPEDKFRALPGLKGDTATALLRRRHEKTLDAQAKTLDRKGIWTLTYNDARYPRSLATIDDAPLLLYGMGRMPPDELPKIAIIGSRSCSAYGLASAKKIAYGLSQTGFVVVSGLAKGIDRQAHKSAMDAAVREHGENAPPCTIAVLGCGVDVCYPPDNRDEYARILRHGCILSEYPPGTKPAPYRFPRRNRIISGLSLGITVVEAEARSGTNITVGLALNQGREVFVVPGSIFSKQSEGTNIMIRDGAIPVTSHSDILWALRRELGYDFVSGRLYQNETKDPEHTMDGNVTPNVTSDEQALLKHMQDPIDVSMLVALTGTAPQDVMFTLTKLELRGLVQNEGGQRYVRK